MGSVNVNRSLTDQFYRYKMPKIIAKVEGKGNGIKTVLVNMTEVAKALNRPPTYPTKYFGCELGAQTQLDAKNDRYIVNGAHEASKLQDILDGFIRRYVLCASCDNPETVLGVLQRKGIITTKCRACGHAGTLDSAHKLNTFILKNPPPTQEGPKGSQAAAVAAATAAATAAAPKSKSKRKSRDERRSTTDAPKLQNGGGEEQESDPQEDDWGDDVDDDWAEDTSEDAKARRLEALTAGAKGLMLDDDLEKTEQERMDIFYNYVKAHKGAGNLDGKEVVGEAERLEVRDKAPLVLCELLFNENILSQVGAQRALLLRFTHGNHRAQRYLLGGIEQVVREHSAALLPRVPHILKLLYDHDIVEEEVLLDWSKRVSKKYVSREVAQEIHERARPFIKWLQEAEEEESSSEGDGDDSQDENVEVVYSDRHISTSIQEVKEQPKAAAAGKAAPAVAAAKGADEDDIDIDAI
ncbi:eukaryotic translation initiation factor 5 [Amblyomma americanum]|uniref:Eukaryotic translation initiation factor 5 n=2 Tax=Amblyomma americanum TaxID=6943 RepID=A0AAQ4F8Y1_AMBAM